MYNLHYINLNYCRLLMACNFISDCSDLGMARGTIPDNDITASTVYNSDAYPQFARLGNNRTWTADPTDKNPWIQVNLQKGMDITAIAVQGLKGRGYITGFHLSFGDDGNTWMNYTVQGETKVSFFLEIN